MIPIIEDARHPLKYRMLVGMVDVVFADVAQPDQARIVALNSSYFLKNGGHYVISIKANCIDSTVAAEIVFAKERQKLTEEVSGGHHDHDQRGDGGMPACVSWWQWWAVAAV